MLEPDTEQPAWVCRACERKWLAERGWQPLTAAEYAEMLAGRG